MNYQSSNNSDRLRPSSLSLDDFELYWEWLTRGSTDNQAQNVKVIRVFTTLDMFEDSQEMALFIDSWYCQHEDTIQYEEMKVGLSMLSAFQYVKFHRFLLALRAKDEEDRLKAEEQELALERQNKKHKQDAQSLSLRKLRAEFNKHALVHPNAVTVSSESYSHSSSSTQSENLYSLHGTGVMKQKQQPTSTKEQNVIGKVVTFVHKYFGRLPGARHAKVYVLPNPLCSPENYENSTSTHVESLDSDRSILRKFSICSDDTEGFTNRLTMANLSIFQDDICSNERMASYRVMNEDSSIDESLVSFDCCLEMIEEY
jgi:hypothetical protein